jgi:DNA-binding NarL/FixJ family response regulator
MMIVSVLLVDDDAGFRRAVKRVSEKEKDFRLVGEAEDGEEALRLERELQPQMIFMDINMPKLNGIEAARRIKARNPHVKIIILTAHDEEAYRRAATESGADGFVLKKSLLTDLNSMMRRAHVPS